MTLDEFRASHETDAGDAAVSAALAAATELVDARLGPIGPVTEAFRPHGPLIVLSRRAVEILSVDEAGTTLDPARYALRPNGTGLERVGSFRWHGRVAVAYQPLSDGAERNRVIGELAALELDPKIGVTSARFGNWAETYGDKSYQERREEILATLTAGEGFVR